MTGEHRATLLGILNTVLRVGAGYVVFTLLLLLTLAHWYLPFFTILKPQLMLILVFYWTLYRPSLLPPWVLLVAGLFIDLMNPVLPVGTHAISYLLVAGLLRPRRRAFMGQPFTVVWAVFVLCVALDLAFKSVLMVMFSDVVLSATMILLNALVTILFFPILAAFLALFNRVLPTRRGMIAG